MIGPKVAKPTKAQEADAYELATLRDDETCQRCRRPGRVAQRDHRQNRRRGNTVPSNLQLLCAVECHPWKTTHPADALADGWAVPSWADPAEWPARRYFRTERGTLRPAWVLYGDDGSVTEIPEHLAHELMGGA